MPRYWRNSTLFVLLVSLFSALGCSSGSSSGSSTQANNNPPPAAAPPRIANLAPMSVTRTLAQGQSTTITVSFRNAGDGVLNYEFSEDLPAVAVTPNSGALAPAQSASVSLQLTCMDADINANLNLTTNDPDNSLLSIPVAVTCELADTGFDIARVTMNQAARGFDSQDSAQLSMPMLAGRKMLVRAFVTGEGQPPEGRVVITLASGAERVFVMQTPTAVSDVPADEALLNASHFAVLPGSALQPNAQLRVELFSAQNSTVLARYPAAGRLDLDVVDPGAFEITFVPVTFNGQTPAIDTDVYLSQANRVLPIGELDAQVRAPYVFTGAYDLEELLQQISDLRDLDGSTRLYHGIIIPPGGSNSGTAGIGYVGYPVSVSVDLGGAAFVIAHELGHNLNLGHAPGCDAPNTDENYPYPDAQVSSWGFSVLSEQLVAPVGKRDFMSYCSNLWVSDYHFERALAHRTQSPLGFGPPLGKGLTVSGQINSGVVEALRLLPTDQVSMLRQADQGAFEFLGWDWLGNLLFTRRFDLLHVEDIDTLPGFRFSVPQPDAEIGSYEIRSQDAVLYAGTFPVPAVSGDVEVAWDDRSAHVTWPVYPGAALIVRDANNTVVSIDRSGRFSVPADATLQFELSQQGRLRRLMTVEAGKNYLLQLTR